MKNIPVKNAAKNISVTVSTHPQNKDITLLSVKGFIDTTTAPDFDRAFQSVLSEKKFNLIIDLKEVNYISSAGWGIFIGEIKRIRGQKGNLFLASMSPEVTEAYELLDFNTIIKSFSDVEQAVQKGFGKTLAKREPENARMDESSGKSQAENSPKPGGMVGSREEPPTGNNPQKPRWFIRIFMPWKWF